MTSARLIPRGGTRGTVFLEVANIRRQDAAVLFANKRYRGALYLAGYAIECLLKWAVTHRRNLLYLPEKLEIHDGDVLLLAQGKPERALDVCRTCGTLGARIAILDARAESPRCGKTLPSDGISLQLD